MTSRRFTAHPSVDASGSSNARVLPPHHRYRLRTISIFAFNVSTNKANSEVELLARARRWLNSAKSSRRARVAWHNTRTRTLCKTMLRATSTEAMLVTRADSLIGPKRRCAGELSTTCTVAPSALVLISKCSLTALVLVTSPRNTRAWCVISPRAAVMFTSCTFTVIAPTISIAEYRTLSRTDGDWRETEGAHVSSSLSTSSSSSCASFIACTNFW
mmetsp:Transcript_16592/g.43062  ORF Transcript_16592/g.43062 Transcript_16592/m.43062 type:complete len:216 (+) Transcript_16592:2098-2745(+)